MIISIIRSFLFSIVLSIFLFLQVHAQESETGISDKDSLKFYFNKIALLRNDIEKRELNKNIQRIISTLLEDKETIMQVLDSVPHLGKLISKDKNLKIINWNLVYEDGSHEYFGYILHYNAETKNFETFTLLDKSKEITNPEEAVLTSQTWFGALYYQIIETEYKETKYYTLLGWDGYNEFKNRKVIEILQFSKKGSPKFGASIFSKGNNESKRRIIFEYTDRVSMALLYDDRVRQIVYDHLAPSDPAYKDQFQYYGPDGSYDTFKFKRGKWVYSTDFDIRNSKALSNKIKKASNKF